MQQNSREACLVKLHSHGPGVVLLRLVDQGLHGLALGTEPEAIVDQLSVPAGGTSWSHDHI